MCNLKFQTLKRFNGDGITCKESGFGEKMEREVRELDGTMASFREEKRVESVSRGTGREEKWRRECHLKYHVLMGM